MLLLVGYAVELIDLDLAVSTELGGIYISHYFGQWQCNLSLGHIYTSFNVESSEAFGTIETEEKLVTASISI